MPRVKAGGSRASTTEPDDTKIFEMQVRICKAFAHVSRLRILDTLGKGPRTVSDLQNELGVSAANVSQHLAILKSAGCISTRRDGKQIYCSLTIPEVKEACGLIRNVLRARVKNEQDLLI
ncbi:MAG: helix-turn-helix transcriptional regulator [Acidobacteria bacterium]|nr:helix-turn-helix transcriptional regulator [Acidobacteriota bacterium]